MVRNHLFKLIIYIRNKFNSRNSISIQKILACYDFIQCRCKGQQRELLLEILKAFKLYYINFPADWKYDRKIPFSAGVPIGTDYQIL